MFLGLSPNSLKCQKIHKKVIDKALMSLDNVPRRIWDTLSFPQIILIWDVLIFGPYAGFCRRFGGLSWFAAGNPTRTPPQKRTSYREENRKSTTD